MLIAYLDAGSGSLLLQLLFGGVAGIGVFVKMRWQRIRAILARSNHDDSEQ